MSDTKLIVTQKLLARLPSKIPISDDMYLRRIVETDAEALADIIARNPDIKKYISWASEVDSVDDVVPALTKWSDPQFSGRYAVVANNRIVGFVHVFVGNGESEFGLGYGIDSENRGKGYATRSVLGLIAQVKATFGGRKFCLLVATENSQSIAIARKLGFEPAEVVWDTTLGREHQRFRAEFK